MYQYLNIKTSNIWWHTFLQHGNQSLGSFFRFRYFQTLGSTAPPSHGCAASLASCASPRCAAPPPLMADDDHSRQPWHRRWQRDNCGTRGIDGCGGSCNNTSIAVPHGNDSYTSCPLYLDPWTGTVQMWPDSGGGGVDVQQHLPSVMLAGALPYDLPPQQAGPTFAPSLTHLPLVAWPPWMTSGALPYGLPPQQAAPTFTSPLPPPPPTSWPPWMSSWS
jgi:hypothetical protein